MPASRPITEGLFDVEDGSPRLRVARCDRCDRIHFPASPTCPYCAHDQTSATLVGPAGHLRLYTVVKSAPPGYRGALPFGFGVVELDGTGLEVITRLTVADPAQLRPGQPVTLVVEPLFEDEGTAVLTYAFAPAVTA